MFTKLFHSFLRRWLEKKHSVVSISPKEAYAATSQQRAVIVDVREAHELAGGYIEHALWIPNSKISEQSQAWKDFVHTLPKEKTIIFYCAAGVRAAKAAALLSHLGYPSANLGGYKDWVLAGLPTTKKTA